MGTMSSAPPLPSEAPHPVEMLVVRAAGRLAALRLRDVIETLRPLPLAAAPGAPPFVRGVAVVRGAAVPVVSLARLLGGDDAPGTRWVALRGSRALEVDEVLGFRELPAAALGEAPALLGPALRDHAEALAVLDGQLLAVLDAARLLDTEAGT